MSMSREAIDRLINDHFGFEATDNVDGVLSTMAENAQHLVVPSPKGEISGKGPIRAFYEMLFDSIKGEGVKPLKRLYGENFVVDEVVWNGEVSDGAAFLCPGRSGKVSFRMLHVFEFEGEKIASEQVWCDLAAIQRQLGADVA